MLLRQCSSQSASSAMTCSCVPWYTVFASSPKIFFVVVTWLACFLVPLCVLVCLLACLFACLLVCLLVCLFVCLFVFYPPVDGYNYSVVFVVLSHPVRWHLSLRALINSRFGV